MLVIRTEKLSVTGNINFIIHTNPVNTTTNIIENSIQETQIQQSKILAIKPTLSAQAQSVNHRHLITSSNVISNSVDNMLDVSSSPDVY
jgi:hypothetical protein